MIEYLKCTTTYCSSSPPMDLRPGGITWVDGRESMPMPIAPAIRHSTECRNCGAPVRASESECSYCKTERA